MLPSAGIAVALYSVAAEQQEAFHSADPWEEALTEVLGNSPGSCGRMMGGGSSECGPVVGHRISTHGSAP
jgi:hypothetical protein